ncbi:MAG: acyltransferase family protein [Sphingomonas sp.]
MLLCLTLEQWRPRLAAWRARWAASAGGALLVIGGLVIPETLAFPVPLALLPVLGTAGLIAAIVAIPQSRAARLLGARPAVAVGRLSYSLYLWHWPVFVLFRWTVGLDATAYQLAALALAVALSIFSYVLVERPLRSSRRIAALPRGRVVLGAAAGIAVSAALGVLLFGAHDRISLSVTRDHALWYADDHPIALGAHCQVETAKAAIGGGTATSWASRDCAATFAIFAPADSHGEAYAPSYRQLAGELGVPVRAYFKAGCPILKLNEPDDPRHRCGAYLAAVLADLRARAHAGDVIFLPGLRLTRFTNQFGPDAWPDGRPDDTVSPAVYADVRAKLLALSATGATLLFEAPKPLYRVPAFRCADWFNRANPICAPGFAISRGELERHRLPVLAAMRRLAAEVPHVAIWDPFPLLCPADPCRALDERGRPRVFDTDHLSGWGNALVYPSLRDAIFAATASEATSPAP